MFPTKAVHHRRHVTLKTQDPLEPYESEHTHHATQPRGSLSRKPPSNSLRADRFQETRTHRRLNTEEQLDKAIHAQELILVEKLWRLEDTLRQKIQSVKSGSAADDDQESEEEEERTARGRAGKGKGHAETGRRTEPQRRRDEQRQRDEAEVRGETSSTHSSNDEENQDGPQRETETHRRKWRAPGPCPLQQEDLQLLPCGICNRKFAPDRLEKHVQVCEKLKNGNRKVFNAYAHRTKGTALEDYLKIHTRSQSPEGRSVKPNNAAKGRNHPQAQLPAGPGEPKETIKANGNRVTCPHCSRHFAPEPAERHIPKCRLVKSRPPPPRNRP